MMTRAAAGMPSIRVGMGIMFLDGLALGIVMPVLPFWVLDRGGSALAATQLLGLYSIGGMVAAPIGGRLADRIGRTPVLLGCLALSVLTYLAMAAAGSIAQMLLFRATAGALTCRAPILRTYLTDLTPAKSHVGIIGSLSTFYTIGVALGPLIPTVAAELLGTSTIGYSTVFIAAAALSAGALALAQRSYGHRDVFRPQGPQANRKPDWRELQRYRVPSCLVSAFGASFVYAVLISITALVAYDRFGWGAPEMGWVLAGTALMVAVARFLVLPWLSHRVGYWNTLALSLILGSAALVITGAANNHALLLIALATLSLCMGVATLLPATILSVNVTGPERGFIQGLVYGVSTLSIFISTLVCGIFYQYVSPFSPFIVAAIVSLATALLAGHEGVLAADITSCEGNQV